jgi:hypothetical protein
MNTAMRMPSSRRLQDELRLTPEQAKLIRAIGHAADDGEILSSLIEASVPKTAEYVRRMHSDPYHSHMWRITVALHAMDAILGTFGVEALGPPSGLSHSPPYEYLNTGETYDATLIYRRHTDTVTIGDPGSIAERHPNWE